MINCEEALELINSYIDGEISESDSELLMSHIASCPQCAELFGILTGVSETFSEDAEPPEELLAGVMDGVRAVNHERKVVSINRKRKMTVRWLSVAACAVAAISLGAFAARSRLPSKDMGSDAPMEYSTAPEPQSAENTLTASAYSMSEADVYEDSSDRAATNGYEPELGAESPDEASPESVKSSSFLGSQYTDFSLNFGKILYVNELPESLSSAEPSVADDGTEYYEITGEELQELVEALDASGAPYQLCETSSEELDAAAVIVEG